MDEFKKTLSNLQNDIVKVMQCLSRLLMTRSGSESVTSKLIDDYLCNLENLCVKSRTVLEEYRPVLNATTEKLTDEIVSNISGSIVIFNRFLRLRFLSHFIFAYSASNFDFTFTFRNSVPRFAVFAFEISVFFSFIPQSFTHGNLILYFVFKVVVSSRFFASCFCIF